MAPGPDRIVLFYQRAWEVYGPSVYQMVREQISNPDIGDEHDSSCVVLLPKNKIPTTCGDLRPIALQNVELKIISKLIVERLKPLSQWTL